LVLARGPPTKVVFMDLRDSLAVHPARLPSPYATQARPPARDSQAMPPAQLSREVVNIRDSMAMHPARLPLQDHKRPPTAKAA